jgi:hypothetical protein
MPLLLITKHRDVFDFARDKYNITLHQHSLSRTQISRLPENTSIFGNLPIPLVADILARPDLRYYHLMIPNVVSEGTGYDHLMSSAFFQRYHVEPMEDYSAEGEQLALPLDENLP